jgi:H+/Cl- antiporter ClcA
MMTTGPREHEETRRERIFVDGQQDSVAGRGFSYLILLNGVAAIVMVGAFSYGFQTSAEPKLAAAMLVFGVGAVAALISSFIAYLNRIVRAEMPERPNLPSILRLIAIAAVIVSGAAFLSGISMVGTTSTAKSSSQPKTRLQDKALAQGKSNADKDASRISPAGDDGR